MSQLKLTANWMLAYSWLAGWLVGAISAGISFFAATFSQSMGKWVNAPQ